MSNNAKIVESKLKELAPVIVNDFTNEVKLAIERLPINFRTYLQYHVVKVLYKVKDLTPKQIKSLQEYIESIHSVYCYQFWFIFLHFNSILAQHWYDSLDKDNAIIRAIKLASMCDSLTAFKCVDGVLGMEYQGNFKDRSDIFPKY